MSERFDAIILDTEISARMRLKQATASVSHFGDVSHFPTAKEALAGLSSKDKCDICFISRRIAEDEARAFIAKAKEGVQGRDAAFVLMLGSGDQGSATIAKNVIAGYDGFLFEPYSVDSLIELTRLATKVRGERSTERESAALRLLVQQIMPQIDLLAELKKANFEAGISQRSLRETCSVLSTLDARSLALYLEQAVEVFMAAPLPTTKMTTRYSGPSKRVQRRMAEKMVEELGKPKKAAAAS